MTCKVERLVEVGQLVLLQVSGHLQEVHVNLIEKLIERETDQVVLDLAEIKLVDREAVKFLAAWVGRGIELRNCPEFIREWMSKV
jgi:hypothetical protein